MGECDGVGAVHREVAVSRGVYFRKGRRAGPTRLARRLSQPFLYPITEELLVIRELAANGAQNGQFDEMATLCPSGPLPGLATTHAEGFLGLQNGFGASLWPDSLAPRLPSREPIA